MEASVVVTVILLASALVGVFSWSVTRGRRESESIESNPDTRPQTPTHEPSIGGDATAIQVCDSDPPDRSLAELGWVWINGLEELQDYSRSASNFDIEMAAIDHVATVLAHVPNPDFTELTSSRKYGRSLVSHALQHGLRKIRERTDSDRYFTSTGRDALEVLRVAMPRIRDSQQAWIVDMAKEAR